MILGLDSANGVNWINGENQENHPLYRVILECKMLMHKHWNCKFVYFSSQANTLADKLAKKWPIWILIK